MAEDFNKAVINALNDVEVGNAIKEKLAASMQDVVRAAVYATIKGAKQADYDPYRTTIHFLVGLIGFCLTLIVGIFTALHDFPVGSCSPAYRMLGGVLAWISITALIAAACAGYVQIRKGLYQIKQNRLDGNSLKALKFELITLVGLPVVFGAFAVYFCIVGGAAILNHDIELGGLLDAIHKIWPF